MASTPAIRRLTRDLEQLKAKPVPNVVAGPVSDSNLFIWSANLAAAFGELGTLIQQPPTSFHPSPSTSSS